MEPETYKAHKLTQSVVIAELNQLSAQLEGKKADLQECKKALLQPVEWDEFEAWLMKNDKGYQNNPTIANKEATYHTYCQIKFGKLQI